MARRGGGAFVQSLLPPAVESEFGLGGKIAIT